MAWRGGLPVCHYDKSTSTRPFDPPLVFSYLLDPRTFFFTLSYYFIPIFSIQFFLYPFDVFYASSFFIFVWYHYHFFSRCPIVKEEEEKKKNLEQNSSEDLLQLFRRRSGTIFEANRVNFVYLIFDLVFKLSSFFLFYSVGCAFCWFMFFFFVLAT